MIPLNNFFKGLTGRIAVNDFIAKAIGLIKIVSPNRKDQKGERKAAEKVFQLVSALLSNNLIYQTNSTEHVRT